MKNSSSITRRNFLASGSALLALPWLESMNPLSAAPTLAKPPTRMIFCGVGYGFTEKTFYPTEAGALDELTEGLSPLERHKKDFSIIKNLTNAGATDPHGGSTSYLTCANVTGTPGKRFHNSTSCDLLAGKQLGKNQRYDSLVLASKEENAGGHGRPGLIRRRASSTWCCPMRSPSTEKSARSTGTSWTNTFNPFAKSNWGW